MINKAIRTMELNYPFVSILKNARSQKKAEKVVDEFKNIVKKQKKLLAKKYHPDVCNTGDETMKLINAACDLLIKLNITFTPPRPQVVRYYTYAYSDTASSTGYF